MNIFTKREWVVVAAVFVLVILFLGFPEFMSRINEFVYYLLIVIPLGILLVTDKERLALLQQHETSHPHRPPTDPS